MHRNVDTCTSRNFMIARSQTARPPSSSEPDERKKEKGMSSALRKSLAALTALFVLLAMCAAAFAKQNPPRTQLPTDTDISVFIGVSATWQSLQIQATRQTQLSAAMSNFAPNETLSVDALGAHEIAFESAMPQTGWALFKPQNNIFQFNFDMSDSLARLHHIAIKDLSTGNLLGQINAAIDGRSLSGRLTADWNTAYYQVEGFDAGGNSLFRLGVTNGSFDTVVPFTLPSVFIPYRPAFVPSGSHMTPDGMIGILQGDPLNAMGVMTAQNGISQGCGYNSNVNDKSTPSQVQPPTQFAAYIKHDKALDTASAGLLGIKSGDPVQYKIVKDAIDALIKRDTTFALTNVDIGPYSNSYGHWHPKFQGTAIAVYAIPFTRKRANAGILGILLGGIQQFLKPGTNLLTELGLSALRAYLATPRGSPYGYIKGEVVSLGDVYMTDTTEAFKDYYQLPIMTNVMFKMTPDMPPPRGFSAIGNVELVSVAPGVTGTPPNPPTIADLNLFFGRASAQLAKGWRWKATGTISAPNGYVTDPTEKLFNTPRDTNVTLTARLTVCLNLSIVASEPCSIVVKLNGGIVKQGLTGNMGGQNAYKTGTLSPGTYTIEATGNPSGNPPVFKKETVTTVVTIGVEQTQNITLN